MSDTTLQGHADRLWAHALHEDTDFTQRISFFLVAQSMLVVAYCGLLASGPVAADSPASQHKISIVASLVAWFGLGLSGIWGYVGRRQWRYSLQVFARAFEVMPEARATHENARQRGPSGSVLMVYAVPGMTAIMWILFVILV